MKNVLRKSERRNRNSFNQTHFRLSRIVIELPSLLFSKEISTLISVSSLVLDLKKEGKIKSEKPNSEKKKQKKENNQLSIPIDAVSNVE